MRASRVGLSAALPLLGLFAVVGTAAQPGTPYDPLPAPAVVTTTTTTAPPPSSTTTAPPLGSAGDGTASVVRRGDQVEVTLATDVLFEFSSADLTPAAIETLTTLAPRLAQSASGVVTIVGHTDSIGTDAANRVLSEARAQAVRDVIAAARPDLQFAVSGRGASSPVAPNQAGGRDNPEGRARNRRVEITFKAAP